MSKVHVLSNQGAGYQLYIHTNMPAGVNSVNNSWQACYVAASPRVSALPVGTGVGMITSSEAAAIVAGSVLEFSAFLSPNADGTVVTATQLNVFVNQVIASNFEKLQAELKYFGYTQ